MPTAVEYAPLLGCVAVAGPVSFSPASSGPLGGRSSGPSEGMLLPAVRTLLPAITTTLKQRFPGTHDFEALAVHTSLEAVNALIGLLRTQGFNVRLGYCDGSVRKGFGSSTILIRPANATELASVLLSRLSYAHGH